MSLEHKAREVFDRCHQVFCLLAVILCTSAVFLFHTRLYDDSDHTVPDLIAKPCVCKCLLKRCHCVLKVLDLCHLDSIVLASDCAARDRHFASDDVDRRDGIRLSCKELFVSLLRYLRQPCAAARDDLI